MARTLVIGYGNPDRQDDGVAYAVVNALRQRLGQVRLGEDETGLEQVGAGMDSVFLLQLAPELLDVAAEYQRLIFVDAHVYPDAEDVRCVPVQPEYATAAFTHHMTPALFLALLQTLYACQSEGHIVSVRGQSFDFERELTLATAQRVAPAVERIRALLVDE
jgi:hydrogenase maturation protease